MRSKSRKMLSVVAAVIMLLMMISSCTVTVHNESAISPSPSASPVVTSTPDAIPQSVSTAPDVSAKTSNSAGSLPPNVVDYLKNNYSEIVLDADGNYKSGLETLDTSKYDVFLGGEYHATQKNYDVKFAFVQYLSKNANVKYILSEDGFAAASYLNIYLQTGELEVLKNYINNTYGSFSFSEENFEFWQEVYAYNQTLPLEGRLTVVGVDLDMHWPTAALYLKTLVENKEPPKEIKTIVAKLHEFQSLNDDNAIYTLISSLKANMMAYGQTWRDYLKDDYFGFDFAVKNCMAAFNAYSVVDDSAKFAAIRESAIIDNFNALYPRCSGGKFFGQWGSEHIYRAPCDTQFSSAADNRFAIALEKKDSPVYQKVCSILYVYDNSKLLNGTNVQDIFDTSLCQTDLLASAASGGLTLFDLGPEGSPFKDRVFFLKSPTTTSTLDYFQYILLIRDSEACTRYKPST